MMTRAEDRVVKRKSFEYAVKAEEMVTVIAVKRTQAEGEKGVGRRRRGIQPSNIGRWGSSEECFSAEARLDLGHDSRYRGLHLFD